MCPGTCKVARLDGNGGMKMHFAKLYFFILLFFLSHLIFVFSLLAFLMFSTFLFLKTQPTRAIAVKCDGGVYRIDVDGRILTIGGLSIYLSIHPATPPREDFVQLGAPEKEKCDRRKLK